MSEPLEQVELTVVDTTTAEWQLFPVAYINANLEHIPLVNDPETGMMVLKMPEGGVMQHGATEDGDCTFLFITNKEFAIHFVGDESDPHAPTM